MDEERNLATKNYKKKNWVLEFTLVNDEHTHHIKQKYPSEKSAQQALEALKMGRGGYGEFIRRWDMRLENIKIYAKM